LTSKRVLLILDNCEHLVADCAVFCQVLLVRCPNLTILATSREPIGVPGEVRWPVPSLGDPDALKLFEARARLVAPEFKVASPNLRPVTEICQRLDRLPLAIEMAAARLDLMSEAELLANLKDRFALLASGSRTAPERQQTMLSAIDWSHRLLTPDEAKLFHRLAVFQGGFTLEAARAVCSDPDGPDTLGILTGLVQKSMVVVGRLDDGSTRYHLLESHHAFALEKLHESGTTGISRPRNGQHASRPTSGFLSRGRETTWKTPGSPLRSNWRTLRSRSRCVSATC
jgi:predicted ATPase